MGVPIWFVALSLLLPSAAVADGMPGERRHRAPPPPVLNEEVVISTPWTLDIPAEPCCRPQPQVGIIAGVPDAWPRRPQASPAPQPPLLQIPPINLPPDVLNLLRQRLGLPPVLP